MEVESGKIGEIGTQSVELVGGKAIVKANAKVGALSLMVELDLDGKVLLDAVIAKLPPGSVQDIAKVLEAAILSL